MPKKAQNLYLIIATFLFSTSCSIANDLLESGTSAKSGATSYKEIVKKAAKGALNAPLEAVKFASSTAKNTINLFTNYETRHQFIGDLILQEFQTYILNDFVRQYFQRDEEGKLDPVALARLITPIRQKVMLAVRRHIFATDQVALNLRTGEEYEVVKKGTLLKGLFDIILPSGVPLRSLILRASNQNFLEEFLLKQIEVLIVNSLLRIYEVSTESDISFDARKALYDAIPETFKIAAGAAVHLSADYADAPEDYPSLSPNENLDFEAKFEITKYLSPFLYSEIRSVIDADFFGPMKTKFISSVSEIAKKEALRSNIAVKYWPSPAQVEAMFSGEKTGFQPLNTGFQPLNKGFNRIYGNLGAGATSIFLALGGHNPFVVAAPILTYNFYERLHHFASIASEKTVNYLFEYLKNRFLNYAKWQSHTWFPMTREEYVLYHLPSNPSHELRMLNASDYNYRAYLETKTFSGALLSDVTHIFNGLASSAAGNALKNVQGALSYVWDPVMTEPAAPEDAVLNIAEDQKNHALELEAEKGKSAENLYTPAQDAVRRRIAVLSLKDPKTLSKTEEELLKDVRAYPSYENFIKNLESFNDQVTLRSKKDLKTLSEKKKKIQQEREEKIAAYLKEEQDIQDALTNFLISVQQQTFVRNKTFSFIHAKKYTKPFVEVLPKVDRDLFLEATKDSEFLGSVIYDLMSRDETALNAQKSISDNNAKKSSVDPQNKLQNEQVQEDALEDDGIDPYYSEEDEDANFGFTLVGGLESKNTASLPLDQEPADASSTDDQTSLPLDQEPADASSTDNQTSLPLDQEPADASSTDNQTSLPLDQEPAETIIGKKNINSVLHTEVSEPTSLKDKSVDELEEEFFEVKAPLDLDPTWKKTVKNLHLDDTSHFGNEENIRYIIEAYKLKLKQVNIQKNIDDILHLRAHPISENMSDDEQIDLVENHKSFVQSLLLQPNAEPFVQKEKEALRNLFLEAINYHLIHDLNNQFDAVLKAYLPRAIIDSFMKLNNQDIDWIHDKKNPFKMPESVLNSLKKRFNDDGLRRKVRAMCRSMPFMQEFNDRVENLDKRFAYNPNEMAFQSLEDRKEHFYISNHTAQHFMSAFKDIYQAILAGKYSDSVTPYNNADPKQALDLPPTNLGYMISYGQDKARLLLSYALNAFLEAHRNNISLDRLDVRKTGIFSHFISQLYSYIDTIRSAPLTSIEDQMFKERYFGYILKNAMDQNNDESIFYDYLSVIKDIRNKNQDTLDNQKSN